jgi:hypothetical protein
MFEPIITIFSSAFGLFKGWMQGKQELQKAKQESEIAAEQNKARLLADKESNNHAWEMAQLTDADKSLRRISFAIFSAPFLVAIVSPLSVEHYFTVALSAMPVWYIQAYMGIIGAVWGISSLKHAIPQIINLVRRN